MKTTPCDSRCRISNRARGYRLLLLGSGLLAVGLLRAQTADTPNDAPKQQETIVLSPFTVTAPVNNAYLATNSATGTRIALPLVSTPMTIDVITSDFMKDRGNTSLVEATLAVPGIRRNGNNSDQFTIRGFQARAARQDGFPNAGDLSEGRSRHEVAEIERLEVIKGPSSVLFGFGNPGGVINLLTKRPQAMAGYSLSAEYGSYDHKRAVFDATGPVFKSGDWELLYRVIAVREDSGGFRYWEHTDNKFISSQLQLTYRNKTTLRAGIRYQDLLEHEAFILMPAEPVSGTLIMPERAYNTAGPDNYAKSKQIAEFVELTHTFSTHLSMRAAFDYDDHYYNALRKVGAQTPVNDLTTVIVNGNIDDDKRHVQALQVDFTGSWDTPIGKFKGVVGASDVKSIDRIFTELNSKLPGKNFPIFNIAARDYSIGNLADYLPQAAGVNNDNNEDKVYYALATLETWQDRLTLMAAVGRGESTTSLGTPLSATKLTTGDFSITKPQFGASLKLVKGIYVFANTSESAAPNIRFPSTPEKGKSYDLGLKANLDKFSATISYFDTTRENIQVQVFDGLTGTTTFQLSGKENAKGVEVEAQYFPTSQFQVTASYAYMDTAVVSDDQNPGRAGTTLPNVPKNALRLWAKYTFKGGLFDRFWAGLGYIYTGEMVGFRNPVYFRVHVPAWERWDAAFGYSLKVGAKAKLDLSLNLENLADKDYIAYAFIRGKPFSANFTATYRF